MKTREFNKSALELAREARKKHEANESTYRDGNYELVVEIVRVARLFKIDQTGFDEFLGEPFFKGKNKGVGRKRDWTDVHNIVALFILNADSRPKEKTANTYVNAAKYLDKNCKDADEIVQYLNTNGGVAGAAKAESADRKAQSTKKEEETWNGLVAWKIWIHPDQFGQAMKINIDDEVRVRVRRVESETEFKQYVVEKLKHI